MSYPPWRCPLCNSSPTVLELQVKTFAWWASVFNAFGVISFLKASLGFSSLVVAPLSYKAAVALFLFCRIAWMNESSLLVVLDMGWQRWLF